MVQIKHQVISEIPVLEIFKKEREFDKLSTVFFYHGWESRKERALEYGYSLAQNGFRAVLPEAIYHGERRPEELKEHDPMNFWGVIANNVKELPVLVDNYIKNNKTDEDTIRVAGLSMGGITTNAMLTQYDWIHSAAVLMGSPSPIDYSKWLLKNYKINGTAMYDLLNVQEVEEKLEELGKISLNLQPEKINHRPVYYWHGTEDQTVPIHLTRDFIAKIKDKPYSKNVIFEVSEGIDHEVPQDIIVRMVDFFKKESTT